MVCRLSTHGWALGEQRLQGMTARQHPCGRYGSDYDGLYEARQRDAYGVIHRGVYGVKKRGAYGATQMKPVVASLGAV